MGKNTSGTVEMLCNIYKWCFTIQYFKIWEYAYYSYIFLNSVFHDFYLQLHNAFNA